MRVLHITTRLRDGAGRVCRLLHEGLQAEGHESRVLAFEGLDTSEETYPWDSDTRAGRFLRKSRWYLEARTGLHGLLGPGPGPSNEGHLRWADVIHLHNLHGYSLFLLGRLERAAPWVWTFHDPWPVTGRCTYPEGCDGWTGGCRRCGRPRPPLGLGLEPASLLFRIKRRIYRGIHPTVVSPSRWLLRIARQSELTRRYRSLCIPNGVDTAVFSPRAPAACRRELGLPPRARVLLFAASHVTEPRKGADLLLESLRRLRAGGLRGVRLLIVGGRADALATASPYPALSLGQVTEDARMALAYSAADLLVSPTRGESFGLTLAESMACGTPCVAFGVGGVPEIVRPGQTGWLARPEDPDDLARCIRQALDEAPPARMAAACRAVAEGEYDARLMTRRYMDVYEELRAGRRANPPVETAGG